MQAIILAAGMGRRLGELTRYDTKCMIEVNGIRIIDRLLANLAVARLSRIVLVIGFQGDKLRAYLEMNIAEFLFIIWKTLTMHIPIIFILCFWHGTT